MKWSIYNKLIDSSEDNEVVFFYNYFRSKLLTLDKRLASLIESSSDDPTKISKIHPDLYKSLLDDRFVISDEINEVAECVNAIDRKFSSDEILRITVNPTLDCNLKCWYCYENHVKDSVMTNDIIKGVELFIENSVKSQTLKKVQLSFFGGEPLLQYKKVVKPLAETVKSICTKYEKKLVVSFTTNGVCLTNKVVEELKNLSSEISVQVAFDGGRDFHNKVKCFPSGLGSYDIVKSNLFNAIQNEILTTIRCNYTLENLDSFKFLVDDFREYWEFPNLRFSFHKVWQEPETLELHSKINELKDKVSGMTFQSNIQSFLGDSISPCYGDFDNNYVANYNGDVYKCTARDFKPENRIGHLSSSGEIILNDNAYLRKRNRLTSQCSDCRLLPICTICFQQRFESMDDKCPIPAVRGNADMNIKKYFHDVKNLNRNEK